MLPSKLFAGDSFVFSYTNADTAGNTWSLTLHLVHGTTKISSPAQTNSTGSYEFRFAPAATADIPAGQYVLSITASDGTDRKTLVSDHRLEVLGDPTQNDNLSFNERMYAVLQDLQNKRLTTKSPLYTSMTIDGVQVNKLSTDDIEKLLDKYKRLVSQEQALKATQEGLKRPSRHLIMVRR